jgi:hypothetical protein
MGLLLAILMIAMYTAGLLITPDPPEDKAARLIEGAK